MQRWNDRKISLMAATALLVALPTLAAGSASQADRDFVGKVSQGGLYEVEAGKVAATRGTVPFIKDFGLLESQDHEGVNSGLKAVAAKTGVSIQPGLNAEFAARLAKLKATPAAQFDGAFPSKPTLGGFTPVLISSPQAPDNDRAAGWVPGTRPQNGESYYQRSARVEYRFPDELLLT